MILLNSTIDTAEDNSFTPEDVEGMDHEEVFTFNNLAQTLDEIEMNLEYIRRGFGAEFEVNQALIQVLMIKRRLHLSVITF